MQIYTQLPEKGYKFRRKNFVQDIRFSIMARKVASGE